MPTARLIPSTYYFSSSSYLSVSNASNMYDNTDSTTYATVTNSRTSTTSYYIYLRGFNFDDIPSAAIVNSFTIKLKARESGVSTSDSYKPYLAHGTSAINGSCDVITTTVATHTFSGLSADWETIVGYGPDFGIRINCRRASRNTTGYMYIYGAEIEVNYTVPDPRTVTISSTGDGTVSPSGSISSFDGDEVTVTITPTDKTSEVSVKKNGSDVTSELVAHGGSVGRDSAVLGTFSLIRGGFDGYGESYFEGLVGNGVDASKTTSNYYSSSSSTQTQFQYVFSFSNIPSNANITRVYCEVNGHAESTSQSSEYMCVQLMSGSTELSEEINFKNVSKSNTTVTLECEDVPTLSQLNNLVLHCKLGYYGGAINGATCYVEYEIPGAYPDYYTYAFTVSGNTAIVVTIGSGVSDTMYFKNNGNWVAATAVYKKINGSWALQTDLTTVFDPNVNYVKGGS